MHGAKRLLAWTGTAAIMASLGLCAARHTRRPRGGTAESFEASQPQHVVESGDTLWDICEKVTGKPWIWPRIWAMNPEITNPHWIFPGDVVRFDAPTEAPPSRAEMVASNVDIPEASEAQADKQAQGPRVEVISTAPPPSRDKRDLVQKVFDGTLVTDKELAESGRLTNSLHDKMLLRVNDLVFMTFPKNKLPKVGDTYIIYHTIRQVNHPVTGRKIGYMTEITGTATVQELERDVARAQIKNAVTEIERGQLVTPLRGDLMVSVKGTPAKRTVEGVVVAIEGDRATAGEQRVIFIDKGKRDGLERGNELRVRSHGDPLTETDKNFPDIDLATLLVVDVRDTSSSALVIDAVRELWAGDVVRSVGPAHSCRPGALKHSRTR